MPSRDLTVDNRVPDLNTPQLEPEEIWMAQLQTDVPTLLQEQRLPVEAAAMNVFISRRLMEMEPILLEGVGPGIGKLFAAYFLLSHWQRVGWEDCQFMLNHMLHDFEYKWFSMMPGSKHCAPMPHEESIKWKCLSALKEIGKLNTERNCILLADALYSDPNCAEKVRNTISKYIEEYNGTKGTGAIGTVVRIGCDPAGGPDHQVTVVYKDGKATELVRK